MRKRQNIFRLAVCLLLFSVVISGGCGKQNEVILLESSPAEREEESSEKSEETEAPDPETLWVHVCGAVMQEGVYELPEGSRGMDAVQAAGGFREDADHNAINLALILEDGQQLRIPTLTEAEEADAAQQEVSDGRVNINTAGREELMTLPGIGASRADAILTYREEHGNFSSIEDIMQVPGIKESSFKKLRDNIKVGIEDGKQGFSSG